MSQESEIRCPQCNALIPLDETLAAPAIAKIKAEASETIKKATEEAATKLATAMSLEAAIAAKEKEVAAKESSVQTIINQQLAAERQKIVAVERENLLKELAPEIEGEKKKANDLQEKLNKAQKAELQMRQEKADIVQREENLELEVARKIDEQRKAILASASKDAEVAANLKLEAKDKMIGELQSKAEQASALAASLALKEQELAAKDEAMEATLTQKIAEERKLIVASERESIRKELAPEIEAGQSKAKELQEKLELSQKAELQLRQEKDEIDRRSRELELEVARKVDDQRKAIQEQAGKDAEDAARLRLAEKDKTISDMQIKLEEAQRKATQGSQQMQGEVLELDFEITLRQAFPQDTVESVKTGSRGGDILQHVMGQMGRSSGTMFWEMKRAQSWGGDWTAKAKQDAAEAKAEIVSIVSEILPKGNENFGLHEGVWCVKPCQAVAFALVIRQGLISASDARQGTVGRETKKDMLYNYMTGPEFRATIEGIGLPFQELQEELATEKRTTQTRWKRQEKRLERVLMNVAAFHGTLQAIAGSEMPQLAGFEMEEIGQESSQLIDD